MKEHREEGSPAAGKYSSFPLEGTHGTLEQSPTAQVPTPDPLSPPAQRALGGTVRTTLTATAPKRQAQLPTPSPSQ